MEIDSLTMKIVIDILKEMYNMAQKEDWSESEAQELINSGADVYADYFRNNN